MAFFGEGVVGGLQKAQLSSVGSNILPGWLESVKEIMG